MATRLTDAILSGSAYGTTATNVMNLAHGGQNGFMARIGSTGTDSGTYDSWISNQAYVQKNIIPVVISYPKFLDKMPDSAVWIAAFKELIEEHPLTIEGLTSGLTADFDEHRIGGAGEMQEEITDMKRARSTPSFTFKEKLGKSIQKFIDYVMRYGYMDPDTKIPLVKQYYTAEGIYTAEMYTATILFIEPDAIHQNVVDAWLCTNMMFKSNGDRTGKRDLGSAGSTLDLNIEMTSITMNNEAVLTFAKTILSSLTVLNKIPDTGLTVPATKIDETISAITTSGFSS